MICVYDPLAASYTGNGAAVLMPTSASVKQVAGGEYSFTMEHPMDPWGKWTKLKREAIVRLPVPEEVIENSFTGVEADVYVTTGTAYLRADASEPTTINYSTWSQYNTYSVGSKVTSNNKNYECEYWDGNSILRANSPGSNPDWWKEIPRETVGSAILVTLAAGAELYFVEDYNTSWYKMSTPYGVVGYIKKNQVQYDHHSTPSENQPRVITEQLFRIRDVSVNRDNGTVSVSGVHVSYDLNGNLVGELQFGQATAAMAVGQVAENLEMSYPGIIATNITDSGDTTFSGTFTRKGGLYCMTDPDSGIVSTFSAKFKRDNWDLFVMDNSSPVDRGYRIRYGKNANGIQWRVRTDSLVTRVMPVAKDSKGNDLYLPEKWVDSTHISDYPVVYMEALSVKGQVGKDDGSGTNTKWTEENLLAEMRKKAGDRFSVDRADVPTTEVTVQLAALEDTAEYAWLKGLLRLTLYDVVQAVDDDLNQSETLKVTEIEYDAVAERIKGVKLSSVIGGVARTVTGYNVTNGSIGAEKLKGDVLRSTAEDAAEQAVVVVSDRQTTVIDNLESTSASAALSANQGRVLAEASIYKAGDSAKLPLMIVGYGLANSMRFYAPVNKTIPTSGVAFQKNFTPQEVKTGAGETGSLSNASYSITRSGDSVFQIEITGLSGVYNGKIYYMTLDSTRTIKIVAST